MCLCSFHLGHSNPHAAPPLPWKVGRSNTETWISFQAPVGFRKMRPRNEYGFVGLEIRSLRLLSFDVMFARPSIISSDRPVASSPIART